ncbi:MAG TPA: SLC13 family permease, partial [Candidatus Hodarchaeales archaeon]|nr:SLC13 family permease [Candidatus Hodarchaeales archaeon]
IDWTLLFFLSGVFLVSDLTSRSGIITFIFDPIISASSNLDPVSLLLFIGYFFGLATSFIENLPLLLLIQPVITGVAANPGFIVPQIGEYLSWWTILASVGITDSLMLVSSVKGIFLLSLLSNEGRKVGFVSYLKFGTLITFVQLFLMSIYIFFLFIILPLVVH